MQPPFTPAAQILWDAIPSHFQEQVLHNVWCPHCGDMTTMTNFTGEVHGRSLGACPRINVYGPLIPRQPYGEGVWMGTLVVSISTVVRHNWFTDGMTPCQEVLAVPMAP